MRWLARLVAVIVMAWCFWRPGVAYACGCEPMYPEMQLAVQESVFLGRVERVDTSTVQPIGLTLVVRSVWKGEVPSTVEAQFQITMCGKPPDFAPGKSYFVYGKEYEGRYLLAGCNRIVESGIGAWHDVLLLTAWDLRVVVPVLIGLQVLLRWRGRRAARVVTGSV